MANPIKAAKQMFDQFLSKHDPDSGVLEEPDTQEKARKLAAKGGRARAARLTPKKRRQIAKRAAKARWEKPSGNS
jgi:hypothetical protein